MAFITPTLAEIRSAILRDILSLEPNADIAEDSDYYVRASTLACCAVGLYAHQTWIVRQVFPDTADSDYLEMHAGLRAIYRKNATYSSGTATVSGVDGAVISAGLQVMTTDQRYYEVMESVTLSTVAQEIKLRSLSAGSAQNIKSATAATFMAAPSGVQSALTIHETLGGTDAETDESLLARLLKRIRKPPKGGTKEDFRDWALEVDGVTAAYVYPQRRGEGTVDIAITSGDGLPSDEIVATCQAHIDANRPVTAKEVVVIRPVIKPIDFVIKVQVDADSTLAEVQADIEAGLTDYFNALSPADTLVLSQVEAVISDLVGVVDRDIVSPAKNVVIDAYKEIGWLKLNSVTVTEM